jgi:hypothetical protein
MQAATRGDITLLDSERLYVISYDHRNRFAFFTPYLPRQTGSPRELEEDPT